MGTPAEQEQTVELSPEITSSTKKKKSRMPVPKLPSETNRKEQALKRLEVSLEDLKTVPEITPTIRACVKGGFKTALNAMRFCMDDPDIGAFLAKYDSMNVGDRDVVSWEAIAFAAGVNTRHLAGSIVLAVASKAATESKLLIASNHPAITRARIKYGKMPSGEKDRTALDIMVGAQAASKGPTFIGKAIFGGGAGQGPAKDDDDDDTPVATFTNEDDLDRLFPPSHLIQDKLVPIRQRLLEK